MRRTLQDMLETRQQAAALSDAQAALEQAEKALPPRGRLRAIERKREPRRGEFTRCWRRRTKQTEDCLPVLGEAERLKAALDTQKQELQRLTEDSSRAQAAYTAAQNGLLPQPEPGFWRVN
ncbi:MAG: hypothetical protein ACLUHE_13200 [Christensenellales bacterium]